MSGNALQLVPADEVVTAPVETDRLEPSQADSPPSEPRRKRGQPSRLDEAELDVRIADMEMAKVEELLRDIDAARALYDCRDHIAQARRFLAEVISRLQKEIDYRSDDPAR